MAYPLPWAFRPLLSAISLASKFAENLCSKNLHFDGKGSALALLLARQIVQPLAADHTTPAVLHQNHIVSGLFANGFLRRIIKPDGQRIAGAIKVDSHLVHRSVPLCKFFVK